jgi:DNA-binding transcriptional MerR regulator
MAGDDSANRYKIGQAAEVLGVKPYVLRFWESEFPQLVPARTRSGQRYYTDEHLRLLGRIKHLLWEEKLTIDGARRRLAGEDASGTLREIAAELAVIRDELKNLGG